MTNTDLTTLKKPGSPRSAEDGDQTLEGFQIEKEEHLVRAQTASSSFLPPEYTNKAVPGEPLIENNDELRASLQVPVTT